MDTESRVTAQNQTSVPALVRRKLGIGPGTQLVWRVEGNAVVVTAKKSTLAAIRKITARRKVKHLTDAQIRKAIIAGAMRGQR
jgi:bifunctional DNA-binding transcriptional regulator/antitoxin component of YhaV-PrlF toxin-antitoxin module